MQLLRFLPFLLLLFAPDAWAVYAATVTLTEISGPRGQRMWLVDVAETGAAAASEWSVVGVPVVGTITHYEVTLGAGAGTTVQPVLGMAATWTTATQDVIAEQAAAAAHILDNTAVPYALAKGTSTIYGRSTVDAGSDNVVTTRFVIIQGHTG